MPSLFPSSTFIQNVEFSSFTPNEIRKVSVKRIINPQAFDVLQRPIPGGLYDAALGAFGDYPCSTCGLLQPSCPGHPGHIELPLPVYHPIYMEFLFRLLQFQCIHCYKFRVDRDVVDLATHQLRLVQFGLLDAAVDLKHLRLDEEEESNGITIIEKRRAHVQKIMKQNPKTISELRKGKHEECSRMGAQIVEALLHDLHTSGPDCASCCAPSPAYRKVGCSKIFQVPLPEKSREKLVQLNLTLQDAIQVRNMQSQELNDGSHESNDDREVVSSSSEDDDGDTPVPVSLTAKEQARKIKDVEVQKYLPVAEVKARMEFLFEKERNVLDVLCSSLPLLPGTKPGFGSHSFFIDTILVPPNRFRPEAKTSASRISEAQENTLYSKIISCASSLAEISLAVNGSATVKSSVKVGDTGAMFEAWSQLQYAVNALIDSNSNSTSGRNILSAGAPEGIKQKLEKKEGLFRMNMMGKRVNFAARSVISPDPNIETSEIGVPPVFANKLTYPEPVTIHNVMEMRQAVINGPHKWPGAFAIEDSNGHLVSLAKKSPSDRLALASQLLNSSTDQPGSLPSNKVHRHLINGDVVLMNRQPTLHKPSMMAHRVRVLPGERTIRLHYANCNTYNADFDGDEMNMHFPQSELARAEAMHIADTDHQYLSCTQGKPLRGLIQDHLSISVALCNKDTFFSRYDYHQLVYAAMRPEHGHVVGGQIQLIPPAIFKPIPRWTGKQVITTILNNVTPTHRGKLWMIGRCQIKASAWGPPKNNPRPSKIKDDEPEPDEGSVKIVDGELVHGILDKSQLGPSGGGFIHAVYEVYGASVAGRLLSSMGRLLTKYLNMRAFTCGMDDLKLTLRGEKLRKELLQAVDKLGISVAAKYVGIDDRVPAVDDPELLGRLEAVMRDDSKQRDLEMLLNQGCTGLSSSLTQSCLPAGLEKQFPENHMQAMTTSGAKGSSVNANLISLNLGQQVLEGRRVPLMVSGKSLPCFRPFETHVRAGGYVINRFLTGIPPQEYYFHHMAGREGLIDTAVKTATSGYLQRCLIKGMEGLQVLYDGTVRSSDGTLVQCLYGEDGLDPVKTRYLHDFAFTLHNYEAEMTKLGFQTPAGASLLVDKKHLQKKMKSAIAHANDKLPSDPVNSIYNSTKHAFATSERFHTLASKFLKRHVPSDRDGATPKKRGSVNGKFPSRKTAEIILFGKYSRSAVEPGEAVGIVAGQSVGEPSTQMTLNTFHLAGHSAKNVTLGVPRLREILMTNGQRINNRSMTLTMHAHADAAQGEKFSKSISRLPFSYVVDKLVLVEKLGDGRRKLDKKLYDVEITLFAAKEYAKEYAITKKDVMTAVETDLLPKISYMIEAELSRKKDDVAKIGIAVSNTEGAEATTTGDKSTGEHDGGIPNDQGNNSAHNSDNEEEDIDESDKESESDDAENDDFVNQKDTTMDFNNPSDSMDVRGNDSLQFTNEDAEPTTSIQPKKKTRKRSTGGYAKDKKHGRDTDDTTDEESLEERVIKNNKRIVKFDCDESGGAWVNFTLEFDANSPKILVDHVVKESVKKTVIRQVPGVEECKCVVEDMKDPVTGETRPTALIHTAGVNLKKMQQYSHQIDVHKTITNDVAAMCTVYGIESCRAAIIQELSDTFGSHSISVDRRHLTLIGDWMTRQGFIVPFTRTGLKGVVSPFTKMSYETTVGFLREAVLSGDWDDLKGPSSSIVMGQPPRLGTNLFEVTVG